MVRNYHIVTLFIEKIDQISMIEQQPYCKYIQKEWSHLTVDASVWPL